MGFRSLYDFNLALLAKQGWRLMMSPDCLMVRVLKVKYYRDSDFLNAELKGNLSLV